jgi:predicted unusual protein kinase regulating ubiquinone biosynthesis (AarF/ABC1/UbiB family)
MARYARVATVLGRFISHLATERYLGVKQDPAALARDLSRSLGRLHGPIVKIAQLLATVPGALPASYVAELAQESGIKVPEPIEELSTGRLLTMTWLEGRPISDFVTASTDLRAAIATKLFRA